MVCVAMGEWARGSRSGSGYDTLIGYMIYIPCSVSWCYRDNATENGNYYNGPQA